MILTPRWALASTRARDASSPSSCARRLAAAFVFAYRSGDKVFIMKISIPIAGSRISPTRSPFQKIGRGSPMKIRRHDSSSSRSSLRSRRAFWSATFHSWCSATAA